MSYKIGPRLRAARLAQCLTHRALGDLIGISARGIMRREQGATDTTTAELRAWAQATGADPRWLLDLGGSAPTMTVAEERGKREAV